MNDIVKAPEGGGLIFQPSETLNKRVIDAENEAASLRKQRSRAVMTSIMASVALLTCALGAAFVLFDANGRVQAEVEKRETLEDEMEKVQTEAARDVEEAQNLASVARRQLTALYSYSDISDARITSLQKKDDLDFYRGFFSGKPTAGLDLAKTFNMQPAAWNIVGLNRENWSSKISEAYMADAAAYEGATKLVEDWMVRTAQPAPAQKNCVTPNPQRPSPRDCEDLNR
jgi:hypothetical protein